MMIDPCHLSCHNAVSSPNPDFCTVRPPDSYHNRLDRTQMRGKGMRANTNRNLTCCRPRWNRGEGTIYRVGRDL